MASPDHIPVEPAHDPPAADGRPLRVLVVDDETDCVDSLALLLRLWGHDVRTARDGPAAVQVAMVWRPDVVVCDIMLPGMDGLQLGAELRRRPECRDTVLLALSGRQDLAGPAKAAGFDHYFLKPVDLAGLSTRLVRRTPG